MSFPFLFPLGVSVSLSHLLRMGARVQQTSIYRYMTARAYISRFEHFCVTGFRGQTDSMRQPWRLLFWCLVCREMRVYYSYNLLLAQVNKTNYDREQGWRKCDLFQSVNVPFHLCTIREYEKGKPKGILVCRKIFCDGETSSKLNVIKIVIS